MKSKTAFLVAPLVLATLVPACEDYDYSTPDPGILEVRLLTKNNRSGGLLPFNGQNFFQLRYDDLKAIQRRPVFLPVYPELNAIGYNEDGTFLNMFDSLAQNGLFVLGKTYAPPGQYQGVEFQSTVPEPVVLLVSPYATNVIFIELPSPFPVLQQLDGSFTVEPNRTTVVTVTCDLDSSLIRQLETFYYDPYFVISSVDIQ